MVDLRDPCEKIEAPEAPVQEGPSVIPVTPQTLRVIESPFPVRDSGDLGVSVIRESSLINQQLLNNQYKQNTIRYPFEMSSTPEYEGLDASILDSFRFSAGKNFVFNQGELFFANKSLEPSVRGGQFYEIKFSSRVISEKERTDVQLYFDSDSLNKLGEANPTFNDISSPEKFLLDYVLGSEERSWPPLIPQPNQTKLDTSFTAPAAFFESEIENSNLTVKDSVMIRPQIGRLTSTETETDELQKVSIYRHYASTVYPDHREFIRNDKIQKFSSTNIQDMKEIDSMATDQSQGSTLYNSAERILNRHIRISISTHHDSDISRLFVDRNLDSALLDYIDYKSSEQSPRFAQFIDQSRLGSGVNDRMLLDYRTNLYPSFDNITALDLIQETSRDLDNHPLGHPGADMTSQHSHELDVTLRKLTLSAAIKEFIQDKRRTFSDILRGKKCFSQVVAYRIEKRDTVTKEIIQNIYLFNDPETESVTFLDTQVVYKNTYEYRIYAVNFVVGNEYVYSTPSREYTFEDFAGVDPQYEFSIENESKIYFIETPYFEQQVKMIDKPPMQPQAELIPFIQQPEHVAFRLTPTYGEETTMPIEILSSDQVLISDMILTAPDLYGKVRYSSDTMPTEYQVLVLDTPPTDYKDFSNSEVFTISTNANSGYISMTIEPNKNYYLIFRALDESGISNPGSVFKLRSNSYSNGSYVDYELYDMSQASTEPVIEFERLISVSPSSAQASIDFTSGLESLGSEFYLTSPDLEGLSLGTDPDHRLWQKKFKFRLTSKTSRKSIDVNIEFQQRTVPSFDENSSGPSLSEYPLSSRRAPFNANVQNSPRRSSSNLPPLPGGY